MDFENLSVGQCVVRHGQRKKRVTITEKIKSGILCAGFVHISWAPCCKTWQKKLKLRLLILKKNVWVMGYPVSWAPCCA
jgi:hypothetical protein